MNNMKKLFLFITATILMSSCYHDSLNNTTTSNGLRLEFMFEKDSVKVYRFYDGGYYHYFTTNGETMTTRRNSNNTHRENIN